jgi:hypothetical protein
MMTSLNEDTNMLQTTGFIVVETITKRFLQGTKSWELTNDLALAHLYNEKSAKATCARLNREHARHFQTDVNNWGLETAQQTYRPIQFEYRTVTLTFDGF